MGARYNNQNMDDPQYVHPNRYQITPITGMSGNYNIIRNPGSATNSSATPISGPNMQRLETAVETIDNDLQYVENHYVETVNHIPAVNRNVDVTSSDIPATDDSGTPSDVQSVLDDLWDTLMSLSGGGVSIDMANNLYMRLDGDTHKLVNDKKWTTPTGSGFYLNDGVSKFFNNDVAIVNGTSSETSIFAPSGFNGVHVKPAHTVSNMEIYVGSITAGNKVVKTSELPTIPTFPDVPTMATYSNQSPTQKLRFNRTDQHGFIRLYSSSKGAGSCNNISATLTDDLDFQGYRISSSGANDIVGGSNTSGNLNSSLTADGEIDCYNVAEVFYDTNAEIHLSGVLKTRLTHATVLASPNYVNIDQAFSSFGTTDSIELSHGGATSTIHVEYFGFTCHVVSLSVGELVELVKTDQITVEDIKDEVESETYKRLLKELK